MKHRPLYTISFPERHIFLFVLHGTLIEENPDCALVATRNYLPVLIERAVNENIGKGKIAPLAKVAFSKQKEDESRFWNSRSTAS